MDEPLLATVSRETLSDQVARQLSRLIAQTLRPGDQLASESSLARTFGVSRPVVREALRTLAAQGLIEIVSGKRALVRPVDATLLNLFFQRVVQGERETPIELMEVRKPLEVQSARLAAERRTAPELAQLADKVKSMRRHLGDVQVFAELDLEFHLLIALATHNRVMQQLIGSIRTSLKDAIEEGLRRRTTKEQLQRVQVLHEAILDGIERADAEAAAAAMARHFDEAVMAMVEWPARADR
jgi:GntR family transcriptional repressor for pyruvate dehydrogenase complex